MFLELSDGAWVAIGTAALVVVTAWYASLTRSTLKEVRLSANAAQRSAEAAERSLQLTTTPLVVWTALVGKVNPDNRPEMGYRLRNASLVTTFEISVAFVRYPVDDAPVQTPFRHVTGSIYPGGTYPPDGEQEASAVIPGEEHDQEQWRISLKNDSYGLVVLYSDVAGRRWRAEMKQKTYDLSVVQVEAGTD